MMIAGIFLAILPFSVSAPYRGYGILAICNCLAYLKRQDKEKKCLLYISPPIS